MAAVTGLSVVIPTWNGRALLEANVPTVLAELDRLVRAGASAELIIVDDGSSDGSAAFVRERFPAVRVVERARNRGFAAACNLGAAAARGDILYFLNSDAELLPDALAAVADRFQDPGVFAVASLEERGWWPSGHLNGGGLRIRYHRAPLPPGAPILFASGGHSAYRRSMFLDLGGFDEGYAPYYWEDVDLCWRAWRRGWSVLLEPRSRVRHAGGGSIPRAAGRLRRAWVRRRNAARFAARHLPDSTARAAAREVLGRLRVARPSGVLYLAELARLGGAERSLLDLVEGLHRDRFRPVVIGGEGGPLLQRLEAAGVEAGEERLPRLSIPREWRDAARAIIRLARVARDEDIAIVHGNSTRANFYAWLAGRAAGARVVWHARNLPHPRYPDVEARLAGWPDAIVANSAAVASRFGGRARVVHNGVDLARFRMGLSGDVFRREIGVAAGVPLVGLVGRIGIGKGHDQFLRAVSRLAAGMPEARAVVVGAALSEEEAGLTRGLEDLAGALGLRDRVIFASWREDVPPVYAALDVVVSATEAEPFGRVLAEAMACGRPVMGMRSGGVPEVVEDGVTGRLVPPGDVQALATGLAELLADPVRRAAMGEAGRRRAERLFSSEKMVRETERVYKDLLAPA